jgi:hypothetical protein
MTSRTDTKAEVGNVSQPEDRGNNAHNETEDLKRNNVDEFGAVTNKLSPLEISLVRKMDWFCLVRKPNHHFIQSLWSSPSHTEFFFFFFYSKTSLSFGGCISSTSSTAMP